MEGLLPELKTLERRVAACVTKRTELQREMERIQSILSENLLRRRDELKSQLEAVALSDCRQQLKLKAAEFKHLETKIETNRQRIEGMAEKWSLHALYRTCVLMCDVFILWGS